MGYIFSIDSAGLAGIGKDEGPTAMAAWPSYFSISILARWRKLSANKDGAQGSGFRAQQSA
jgi:hypothetical protein